MDPRLAALDEAQLDTVIAPFGEERTLPGAAYTSQDVFDWEMDELWHRGWVAVGRADDFPPGHAVEVSIGSESLVVVNDSGLRAFFNVCRHRGHELLEHGERRVVTSLRCPYHGWVYGLDGRVRAAPKMHHRSDIEGTALVAMRVETWHGWVLVAVDPGAPPLSSYADGLGEKITPWAPEALQSGHRRRYAVAANWKLIHENYHECYHCPSIHPELTAVANPDSGLNFDAYGAWVGGSLSLRDGVETLSLDGRSHGTIIGGLGTELRTQAMYVGLVPNLLISLHPDYVITHRLEALAPSETIIHCEWLFPTEAVGDRNFDPGYAVEFWDITNRQDWDACESLQRGAASRGYRPGMLGAGEDAVYQFIGMVARCYVGEALRGTPNPGRR